MKFKSQICTRREQSERLLALGLKKETADMALIENWEYDLKDGKFFTGEYFERPIDYTEGMTGHYIPAWSLHRIISMVYSSRAKKNVLGLAIIEYENPFEDMIRQIEWLIKKGYFNKEYLV